MEGNDNLAKVGGWVYAEGPVVAKALVGREVSRNLRKAAAVADVSQGVPMRGFRRLVAACRSLGQ